MGPVQVRRSFLVLALAAVFILHSGLTAGPAYACSCAGLPTPIEESRSSDTVFVGEAVENGLEDPDSRDDAKLGGIRFDVSKSWKGTPEDSTILYGQSESYYGPPEKGEMMVENSCAVPFALGKTYLVYASRMGDSGFFANACGGTGTLAGAGEDLQALGRPADRLPDTGGLVINRPGAMVVGTIPLLLVAALVQCSRWRTQAISIPRETGT